MKVGVIQSNYLPWRGYFDLIDDVDLFIFYDDVQYTKNDWRNRNRIRNSQGALWLTVPVCHRSSDQLILETEIDDSQRWRKKHLRTIAQAYGRARYFDRYYAPLAQLIESPEPNLARFNHALTLWLMSELGITTPVRHSVEFPLHGSRNERLLNLLRLVGAKRYLSGPAARSYLDQTAFAQSGIQVEYKTYDYTPYPQPGSDFLGDLSVIDLLFHTGPGAREFLKSRRPAEAASASSSIAAAP